MEELLIGLVPGLPPSLREQILARAEGVPLYAVETVRMLLDRGLLVEEGSGYQAGRRDRLARGARDAARADRGAARRPRARGAAAARRRGRARQDVRPPALAALTGLEPSRARTAARRPGAAGRCSGCSPIRARPSTASTGSCRTSLRHVAYETLPKRERRAKHLAAAEHLAATLGEDEVAEVIASHLLDAYRLDPDAARRRTTAGAGLRGAAPRGRARRLARRLGRGAALLRAGGRARDGAGTSRRPRSSRAGEMAAGSGRLDGADALFEQAIASTRRRARRTRRPVRRAGSPTPSSAGAGSRRRSSGWSARTRSSARTSPMRTSRSCSSGSAAPLLRGEPRARRGADRAWARHRRSRCRLPEVLARGWNTQGEIDRAPAPPRRREASTSWRSTRRSVELHDCERSCCINLSDLAFQRDRYAESLEVPRAGARSWRAGPATAPAEWFALSEMTYALAMLGRWDEALARLAEIPDEQLGTRTLRSLLNGVLEFYLHRGGSTQARELLARFESLGRVERSPDRRPATRRRWPPSASPRDAPRRLWPRQSGRSPPARRRASRARTSSRLILHALEAALALGRTGEGRTSWSRWWRRSRGFAPALPRRDGPPLPRAPGRR